MSNAQTVIILRGISGAGKSTHVRTVLRHKCSQRLTLIASADHYFYEGGEYAFNPAELGKAHDQCFDNFCRALEQGTEVVIVDNTNLSMAEIAPYRMVARRHNAAIEYHEITCDVETAAQRSQHAPPEAVKAQAKRGMEEIPPFFEGVVKRF